MVSSYVRYWGSHLKHSPDSQLFAGTVRSVVKAGWKAYLVCSRPPDDPRLAEEIVEAGAEIVYLPRARGNFDLGCVWRAYRLFKRLACDVMHCDNMHTSPLIGAALAGVPVRLWSKRSMNPVYETMRKPTLRDRIAISIRVSCWLATQVLPVSTAVKNELAELGIPSAKLTVLPNPAEIERLNGQTRNLARAELGYSDDEIVFTTVGHAVPVKGWDVLAQAFARVVDRCSRSKLQFVGSVTDKHERECFQLLEEAIRALGLADRVRFLGHHADVREILAASDVFVLPSKSEGCCNALLEAMTCGLPCIATKVGNATDIIEDGINGILVERANEGELATAIVSLSNDTQLRRRIADAAQENRPYGPSRSEYGERLLELCRSLLAAGKPERP